jgi:hypothetical protein
MRALTIIIALAVIVSAACSADPQPAPDPQPASPAALDPAQEAWWANLRSLCGNAYAGALAAGNDSDASFAGKPMVMHVRRCTEDRIEIPFHVGEDRSRTWVLTRTTSGLQLRHDHRHEDGSEDPVTLYGGHTRKPGTPMVQFFPADDYSKVLFAEHELPQSAANVWSLEIEPNVRFSYVLRRPNRHFQVDFSLATTVEPPPAPWGHGTVDPR